MADEITASRKIYNWIDGINFRSAEEQSPSSRTMPSISQQITFSEHLCSSQNHSRTKQIFSHPYSEGARLNESKWNENDQKCCVRSTKKLAHLTNVQCFFCCRSKSWSFRKWNRAFRSSNIFTNIEMTDQTNWLTLNCYFNTPSHLSFSGHFNLQFLWTVRTV